MTDVIDLSTYVPLIWRFHRYRRMMEIEYRLERLCFGCGKPMQTEGDWCSTRCAAASQNMAAAQSCLSDGDVDDKVVGIGVGWSSLVARRSHKPQVTGSNPVPATNDEDSHE